MTEQLPPATALKLTGRPDDAVAFTDASPFPDPAIAFADLYTEPTPLRVASPLIGA